MTAETRTLKARLAEELRAAMKERRPVRVSALRMLTAAVKNREVDLGHELSDDELVDVAAREVKRRREAAEAYEEAGRPDRAATEREEERVLQEYLPAPLSDGELRSLVDEAIAQTRPSGPRDLGKVMGFVMSRARGRVDGRAVQQVVRERLGS